MSNSPERSYALGHSAGELRRLDLQSQVVDPITTEILQKAGLQPGMRVLDVGCGAGHVSFLVSDLVGPNGHVTGVDVSAAAVQSAGDEAERRGLGSVEFVHGDPAELTFERPFDAVVGRYVLQFQEDPARFLSALLTHVRPSGVVAFHELDWSGPWSAPELPTLRRLYPWAEEALRRSGADTRIGLRLRPTFVAAGLSRPTLMLRAVVRGGPEADPMIAMIAGLCTSLLPAMERYGIATAEDLAIDTLGDRLRRELDDTDGVLVGHLQVGCWAIRP